MAYLGKTPSQAVRSRYYFTASGGETSLSGTDDNGNTLTYTDGNYVDVSLNGVALVAGSDYNTTTANTIGGLTALTASDVVEVVVYDTFSVFGGKVLGDFDISNGTLSAEAVTVTGLTTTGNINFGDNDKAVFGAGSDLQIYHDGSNSFIKDAGPGSLQLHVSGLDVLNAAAGEFIIRAAENGSVDLYHDNSKKLETTSSGIDVTGTVTADGILNNNKSEFFASEAALVSTGSTAKVYATNSTFDGVNGSLVLQSRPTSGADVYIATGSTPKTVAKFNDGGDISFYDSTGTTQGLFWDASTQRLGLGTTAPGNKLSIANNNYIAWKNNAGSSETIAIRANTSDGLEFLTGSTRMTITSGGNVGIGTSSPSQPLTISTSGANGLYLLRDGSTPANSARVYLDSNNTPWAIMVEDGELSFRSAPNPGSSSGTERVAITVNGINSSAVAANTTVSSPNLFISGGNNFQKSTSSRRYKTEITDAAHGLADVLNLRSVTYKGVNDGETIFGGLIAEEVHDAGLTEFVNYSEDENGNNVPEGVHYGHMVSLAFKAIQELKAELDAEKAKVADLIARIETLENA